MAFQNATTWEDNILERTTVITKTSEGRAVINKLMRGIPNENWDPSPWPFTKGKLVVAVDCEGVNLGSPRGKLCLVQLATMDGICYIFDVYSCPHLVENVLKRLLESSHVIKVIHDCRNDIASFRDEFGVILRSVFDTRVANEILAYQRKGFATFHDKNISLNTLCGMYDVQMNDMKTTMKEIYKRDPRFWSRRPLTDDMVLYAAADAYCLGNKKIYLSMVKEIAPRNRFRMLRFEQYYM